MESVIQILISVIAATTSSFLVTLFAKMFSKKSHKNMNIKVGDKEIRLSDNPEDTINQLNEMVLNLQKNPSVFISSSGADKDFARKLAGDLQANGIKTWIDEAQLKVGDSLFDKIGSALSSSQWFLVILSNDALNSKWPQKELEIAMADEKKRGRNFVLPIMYKDTVLPPQLANKLYADFRKDYQSGLNLLLKSIKPVDSTVAPNQQLKLTQ